MATSQNQPRTDDTRRYFSGNKEQPKQYQVYQCSCGAYQQRHSAQHWRSTNWQGSACNRCGKRVNLNWGKCQFFDTKEKAEEYIHNQYAGERLKEMGLKLAKSQEHKAYMHRCYGFDDVQFEAYTDELYWLNKPMYEDYLHIQAKHGSEIARMMIAAHIYFEYYTSPEYTARMNNRHQPWTRKRAKKLAMEHTQGGWKHLLRGAPSCYACNSFLQRWLV